MNQAFLNRKKRSPWSNYEPGPPTYDQWLQQQQQQDTTGNSGKFWGFLNNLIDTAGNAYDEFNKKKQTQQEQQQQQTSTTPAPVDVNRIAMYGVVAVVVVVGIVLAIRMLKK